MKVFVPQYPINIGNFQQNSDLILENYNKALELKCDVCLFSELCLTGYLPQDLLLKQDYIENVYKTFWNKIVPNIKNCTALISIPVKRNKKLHNICFVVKNGKVIGQSGKKTLPNYSVFEESRYFGPSKPSVVNINGFNIAILICEDLWTESVIKSISKQQIDLILSPNASPFELDKLDKRIEIASSVAKKCNAPLIYSNQLSNQDGILYDGSSMVINKHGNVEHILEAFEEGSLLVNLTKANKNISIISSSSKYHLSKQSNEELIYKSLLFGLKTYISQFNLSKVIIGLSGGIDSAFVSLVAREAFGANNVIAVFMPSKFTTKQSIKDAEQVADNLQIKLKTISIDSILNSYASDLEFLSGIAYENIQARIRGNILMALSNSVNGLVLTTGNKSEIATGYCTIYGDMCGAFNPIKDLYKTTLYNVVKWRNKTIPEHQSKYFILKEYNLIPNSIVTKSPSAELRENQKDSDSLPEYNLLDQILHNYIEKSLSVNEIISLGFDEKIVNQVASLVNLSEYKRKQSAPGIKITKQSFEKAEWKLNTKIQ